MEFQGYVSDQIKQQYREIHQDHSYCSYLEPLQLLPSPIIDVIVDGYQTSYFSYKEPLTRYEQFQSNKTINHEPYNINCKNVRFLYKETNQSFNERQSSFKSYRIKLIELQKNIEMMQKKFKQKLKDKDAIIKEKDKLVNDLQIRLKNHDKEVEEHKSTDKDIFKKFDELKTNLFSVHKTKPDCIIPAGNLDQIESSSYHLQTEVFSSETSNLESISETEHKSNDQKKNSATRRYNFRKTKRHISEEVIKELENDKIVIPTYGDISKELNHNKLEQSDKTRNKQESLFTCRICDLPFTSLRIHHRKYHSKDVDPPFECEICGRIFFTKNSLKNHHMNHTGDRPRPFRCQHEHCDRSFTSKASLEVHLRSHTGERPFSCQYCGHVFSSRRNTQHHELLHLRKPFLCNYANCFYMFPDEDSLRRHQWIHNKNRPHRCEKCGKSYLFPGELKEHQMKHTGERPFSCEICGRLFKAKNNLKHHQMAHSGVKNFQCKVCGRAFLRKHSLQQHQFLKHTDQYMSWPKPIKQLS